MQRSAWKWMTLIVLALAAMSVTACSDEGVGDPCTPETVPVNKQGVFGFEATESYIESSSVQCRSRLCIVHHLDNGTNGPADPRKICPPGAHTPVECVTNEQLLKSVHCTCKCGGPKTSEQCECPDGFKCTEVLTLGGEGIRGSYCVKP